MKIATRVQSPKAVCYNTVDNVLQSNHGASRFQEVSREA
jgi:hypothetical protein